MTKRDEGRPEIRIQVPADPRAPAHGVRRAMVAEVRRRLESGELDSDLALVETALALLDGDSKGLAGDARKSLS